MQRFLVRVVMVDVNKISRVPCVITDAPELPETDWLNCNSDTASYVVWYKTNIVSTSLSNIQACFDGFFAINLSCRDAILATRSHRLQLITSDCTVQSRYCSDSEMKMVVCQCDQIDGDIDYQSKCSKWFTMTILIIYGNTNFKWNLSIGLGYPDGNWASSSVPSVRTNHSSGRPRWVKTAQGRVKLTHQSSDRTSANFV